MAVVSMKALLETGVHFGHRTRRWNPKMKPYIFTERNGVHIIDLQQTIAAIESAYKLIRDTVAQGGTVLLVGTKRQAQETIALEAERCGMPYVNQRWLGGTLTNWRTIRKRIDYLLNLEARRDRGDFDLLKKIFYSMMFCFFLPNAVSCPKHLGFGNRRLNFLFSARSQNPKMMLI